MSGPIIIANGLARWYGQVLGLNRVDLEIRGGITGLIGPNGAGKSTLVKLVTGQIRPSTGKIAVLGQTPFANRRLLARIGYCPTDDALYEDMSARTFLEYSMRLQGLARTDARTTTTKVLETVELTDAADRPVRGYSKGMRQRVKLAQSIAHEPELLVADEPLAGLDPLARRLVGRILQETRARGAHVLLSSHVLHEVEPLTDRIVLLNHGRILGQGSVAEMRDLLVHHPRKVVVRAHRPRALACRLLQEEFVVSAALDPDGARLHVETVDLDLFLERLPTWVCDTSCGVLSLESPDASLEAVFDYMVT